MKKITNKKKVIILGVSGMLGFTMYKYFSLKKKYETYGTINKNKNFIDQSDSNIFKMYDANNVNKFNKLIKTINPNFVINCIGIIKQKDNGKSWDNAIQINSLFPKKIGFFCSSIGVKFLQISTDCVFDGLKGHYKEFDTPNANDIYGISKFLGESNNKNIINIRTSIIGHEKESKKSFLEWVLSNNLKTINGFSNAIFSGVTTLELSKIIHNYALNNNLHGLYHVSTNSINKYKLIVLIIKEYNLKINVIKDNQFKIDRSLDGKLFKNKTKYKPKSWKIMLKELRIFFDE